MRDSERKRLLAECGAVINNVDTHFVYASGRHGTAYIDKEKILYNPESAKKIAEDIAAYTYVHRLKIETPLDFVAGPVSGGAKLADLVSKQFQKLCKINPTCLYISRLSKQSPYYLDSNVAYSLNGKKVLLVDDVLTTGSTLKQLVSLITDAGAEIVGVAVICNRGGVTKEDLSVQDLYSFIEISLASWEADDCILCRTGTPINTQYGRGKEFVALKKKS